MTGWCPPARVSLPLGALVLVVVALAVGVADGAGPARNGLIVYSGAVTANAMPEVYAFPVSGAPRVDVSRNPDGNIFPRVSPDGTKVAFLDVRVGWEVAASDGSGRHLLAAGTGARAPNLGSGGWSVESRHFAGTDSQGVVVFDVETAAVRHVGRGGSPQWSPRETSLAYIGPEGRDVYLAPAEGPSRRVLAGRVNEIRWSPDGKRLACVGRGGIEIVDPASGVKTEVVLPDANVNSLRWSFDG